MDTLIEVSLELEMGNQSFSSFLLVCHAANNVAKVFG